MRVKDYSHICLPGRTTCFFWGPVHMYRSANAISKHVQVHSVACQDVTGTGGQRSGSSAPEGAASFRALSSPLPLLTCVWQDSMLPLLELLPFSSSMLDLGRLSSSALDLCSWC